MHDSFTHVFAWGVVILVVVVILAIAIIDIVLAAIRDVPTLSQYVTRKARGEKGYKKNEKYEWYIWILPGLLMFLGLVGLWLVLHFEAPCITFGVLCELGEKL